MKTKLYALVVFLLGLVLTACDAAFAQPPSVASLEPTVTPEVFIPATMVAPKGPMVSGRVLWGAAPAAGARVELRTGAWGDPNASQVIAVAFADDTGTYQLEAPPAGGQFGLVAVWPDGSANPAPVTPVQVTAGQTPAPLDVYLAKELKMLEPASGAEVGPTPTLRWEGQANVAQYRVLVIDAGTTVAALDQVTTDTSLALSAPLIADRTYQWVVNGLTDDNRLLASLKGEFKVAAQTAVVAQACQATDGLSVYTSQTDGYCFAYPQHFELELSKIGQPVVRGPALDKSPDPIRATLVIEAEVAVRDKGLAQIVDGYLSQFDGMTVPAITRTSLTLGGEPAEMLEVVPGREGSREVFALRNGELFHLMFMPSVRDFPAAQADVESLFQAVVGSWKFESRGPASDTAVTLEGVHLNLGEIRLADAFPAVCQDLPPACTQARPGYRILSVSLTPVDLPAGQMLAYKQIPAGTAVVDDTGGVAPNGFSRYDNATGTLTLGFEVPATAKIFVLRWGTLAFVPLTLTP